jgi:hypothetical protein
MTAPDPFKLFAFYHLGFDENFNYRFRNLHQTARHFGAEASQVLAWLEEYGMDPETVRHVDFNLSRAHADAQELDLEDASMDERERFARDAFRRFQESRKTRRSTPYEDIDWEDPLGVRDRE